MIRIRTHITGNQGWLRGHNNKSPFGNNNFQDKIRNRELRKFPNEVIKTEIIGQLTITPENQQIFLPEGNMSVREEQFK